MDRYGYLINPGAQYQELGNPTRRISPWVWVVGVLVLGVGIWWLVTRHNQQQVVQGPAGKLKLPSSRADRIPTYYPVTAPATDLLYDGAGMPFGTNVYEPAGLTYIAVDNNGIARCFAEDGRPGGLVATATGQRYFVGEQEWNEALYATRAENMDVLETIIPYFALGPGYIAYVADGLHIGESVFVTLQGQIGRVLYRADGGELTFVPLEVLDQTPDVWSQYVKPA